MTSEEREKEYNIDTRKRIYQEEQKNLEEKEKKDKPKDTKKLSSKYMKNGELRQCNEGKWEFRLFEYEDPQFTTFHINLPKFMDTSLIDVEIFPHHISIRVKDKLTQIKMWEEVFISPETLQRSKTTGELFIKLKKVKYDEVLGRKLEAEKISQQ